MIHTLTLIIFLFGTIIGSFLNVCIYRIPRNESVITTGSHCPHCHTFIKPYDNIPILSFIILKGKCRQCHQPIHWRYPLVELLTGVSFALNFMVFHLTALFLLNSILAACLIIIAFIDIDKMIIHDRFHIIILLLGVVAIIFNQQELTSAILGVFVISVPLAIITVITSGFGGGDIKLMAAAGLYLGATNILVAFLIGLLTGGTYASYLLLIKKAKRKQEMPFGPFLCLGIYLASLYGPQITNFYLGLF